MLYFVKKTKNAKGLIDSIMGRHEWLIIFSNGNRVKTSGTLREANETARREMEVSK